MINELMKVADAMQALSRVSGRIPEVLQPLPKASTSAPCIRVWLTSDGQIDSLEKLSIEHTEQLKKFAPNKHSSLPGFNVTYICGIEKDDDKERELKKTLAGLKRNFTAARYALERACADKLDEGETLATFLAVVKQMDAAQFQESLDDQLANANLGWCPKPGKHISVFLDIKDYKNFPVAHTKTLERLNALLYEYDLTSTQGDLESFKDAYDGDAAGADVLFNDVSVPRLLGQIKIRSLNKDIPAQRRYHLVGSATFPVGKASRERAESALKWISALENEGTTFGVAGDSELLFAYPIELPLDSLPQLATLLGAQREDVLTEQKFNMLAKSVIDQLKGSGEKARNVNLEIFSLRKMDKARTKVVYYRNTTVSSLETASHTWEMGCENIPALDIRKWGEGKNDKRKSFIVSVEPRTIFPVKLHKVLNTIWRLQDGKPRSDLVKLFEPSVGLCLLLDTPEAAQTAYVMERYIAHAQTYFVELCRFKGRNEIAALPDLDTYPGILGLLLYKLGKTKENYMNENAFLLGRFLRVADEIHRLYCEVVRPNDRLPELCGSSLLSPMLESPLRTFNQLATRTTPYLKWARRFHGEEKSGLAHYWMRQWATIADSLHCLAWPERPSPEERAQIFLGYLSSFPKSENSETSTETTKSEGTLL